MVFALFVVEEAEALLQSFQIVMLIECSLKSIMENPWAIRQIAKWATKLKPYGITYEPRTTIKGQILVDFNC